MSVDVGATVVIERPLAEVAAYAGDPTNAPAWQRHVDAADWITDPPVRLGSRAVVHARFLGRSIDVTVEVVELSLDEQVVLRTVDGPVPIRTVSTWRPVGDRVTHMALQHHATPTGLQRLLAPLLTRVLRRVAHRDLADLKQLLER